jgi:hypothetical protein
MAANTDTTGDPAVSPVRPAAPPRSGPAATEGYDRRCSPLAEPCEGRDRTENRSEHTIASCLESLRQTEAFLAGRGRSLVADRAVPPGRASLEVDHRAG